MNARNNKQYTHESNGYSGSFNTSGTDELNSDEESPETILFSPQVIERPNINPSSNKFDSAQHLSSLVKSTFWGRLRLRTKAMLAAIAIGTLPVIAVGTIAFQIANQQLVKQIQQDKTNTADALDNDVLRFIFERYGDIQVLASLPILRNPQVREIVPLQQKEAVLDNLLKTYGVYDSIAVYDLNGGIFLHSQGKAPSNAKDRQYFQEVLKTDKPFIGDPEISQVTGEPVLFFAAPVKDVLTGKTIGVVRTRMLVKNMDRVLANYRKGSDEFLLVDPDGKIFAAKEADDIGKDAKSLFASYPQLAAAQKPAIKLETDLLDNAEHLFAYSPFEKFEGLPDLNWSSIITQPSKDAYAPQYLMLWTMGIGTAVTALLMGAIAAYLAN
ncbi:MAG TPA: chemotaxis protein, partial [Cyanobacteria bacterium UBA11049]|nr:chemotaxis protein [Cyanobacteria bacterium UBA11049]